MNLVQEIEKVLSDTHPNLENAFIKTKVLLHRLGARDYVDWINKELNGYSEDDEVPSYRVTPSSVKITATDGFTRQWTDIPAPTIHLKKDVRKWVEQNEFRQSISSLESLAHSKGDTLTRPIPIEFWGMFSKGLSPGIRVENAHCETSKAQLQGVLTQIRSRLLDFVLELEAKIPPDASEEDLRTISKKENVGNLLNHAMFGSNTTIVNGDNNSQSLTFFVIQKGDFASLSGDLKSRGVSDIDIGLLKKAIEEDEKQVDHENKQYGPRVKEWLKTMLSKSVDSIWKVGVGAAGSLLAKALQIYYGWPET